jgi:hypothetical protein
MCQASLLGEEVSSRHANNFIHGCDLLIILTDILQTH